MKLSLHDVKDLSLASQGKLKIEWAGQQMPVVQLIKARFSQEKPLKNITLGACLHVTAETANLMLALKAGGAKPVLCASNPLSTQDDVAAALVKYFKLPVFALHGENKQRYYQHINKVLDYQPQITMDDGADLISVLHSKRKQQLKNIIGSSEETTTGVIRLRAMEKDKSLKLPVIAVNDSATKHLFDNRYGTGQSTIDGILRATNILLAGKTFVVCGYGWCGRGIARRAKGMGSKVIITEINPVKALEASMDGFQIMPIQSAAKIGDIFVTATGNKKVIDYQHIKLMKSGAILANAGHFNVEINIQALKKAAQASRQIRTNLQEYMLGNKKIYLLAEGRLVNLAAAEGHPAEVMDLSFANQALAAEYLIKHQNQLDNKVYILPQKIDQRVARLKLRAGGFKIDQLTPAQKDYLSSWQMGT
ncbi:adenosylhomocysteinase [Patescibacteria group bacterium]|nr:adenosylhomocysteinase [Patescibacteria group bacterium]MBU1931510.1 adenosylhomocysteinase [Patescibacteria group bacterium]